MNQEQMVIENPSSIATVQTESLACTSNKTENSENEIKIETNETENSKILVDTYLKALCHAVTCSESNCRAEKCYQFKRIIEHSNSCKKVNTQCDYCRQLVALCVVHAKSCQETNCQIPDCHVIKGKLVTLHEFKAKSQSSLEFIHNNLNLLKYKKLCDCQNQTDMDTEKVDIDQNEDETEKKSLNLKEKIEKIKLIPTERLTSREEKLVKFDRKLRNHLVKQLIELFVDKFDLKEKNFYKSVPYASLVAFVIKTEVKLYASTNNSDDYLYLLVDFLYNLEKEFSKKSQSKIDIELQTDNVAVKSKNSLNCDDESDLEVPPSKKVKIEN
ncbi:unnamed protein product [Brachionus calyciflorus]|uniref:histone acetyltransferase n=1 Tax=Brachionus calyciflorus TaxID=104777 RepID=A0A813LVJ4_9BILA|nr:unnamed protein product [Brachionus calyciflorus]